MSDKRGVKRLIAAVTVLAGGAAGAQLITLLGMPLLARLYSEDAFGYLALVTAVSGMGAMVIGLRLESALLIEKCERLVSALFVCSIVSALILSWSCYWVIEALSSAGVFGEVGHLPGFAFWCSVSSFATSFYFLNAQLALRDHRYREVGIRNLVQGGVTTAWQLSSGLVSPTGPALVCGLVAGRIGSALPVLKRSIAKMTAFGFDDVRTGMRRYWRYPLVFAPSEFLNAAGLAIPLVFVGSYYGVGDAGQWGMAERILAIPLALVGVAVGQVIEAQFAQRLRNNEGGIVRLYWGASSVLFSIALLVLSVVIVATPIVIPTYLGGGWNLCEELLPVIAIGSAARLVAVPLAKIFVVRQMAALNFSLDGFRICTMGATVVAVVALEMSVTEAAWWFSIAMLIIYLVTWFVGLVVALRSERCR